MFTINSKKGDSIKGHYDYILKKNYYSERAEVFILKLLQLMKTELNQNILRG